MVGDVAELLPLPLPMELIKGRKARRTVAEDEEMLRVPPTEDRWEVACSDQSEYVEREVPTVRKRRDLPIAS